LDLRPFGWILGLLDGLRRDPPTRRRRIEPKTPHDGADLGKKVEKRKRGKEEFSVTLPVAPPTPETLPRKTFGSGGALRISRGQCNRKFLFSSFPLFLHQGTKTQT
jgi:hypothetical protein